MEKTLVKCTQLTEHRETTKCERDAGGSGSGCSGSSKRAKSGTSNDFRKLGKGFDPDTISLAKKPQLTAKDVECPICWAILYEPTTLPCNHSLCTACFLQHAEETSLYCPLCRRRLSIWSRKAKKKNELLDKDLWERLKSEFSELIAARENGNSQEVLPQEELAQPAVRDGVISETPGAIFNELKQVIKPHEEDLEKKRREDEAASIQLIQKIQEEEIKKLEIHKKTEDEDFKLAISLQEEYQRNIRENENNSRKSERSRAPCSLLNDYHCSFGTDLRHKSRPKKKILSSRKEEKNPTDRGESAQKRVDPAAAAANDDFHIQGASVELEPMETELIDHDDRSAALIDVCLLIGPILEEMETENDNHAEPVHLTSLSLLEQPPGSLIDADEKDTRRDQSTGTVPLTYVDLPEQLAGSSTAVRETKFNDKQDQPTEPSTSASLSEQLPVSSKGEEKETEVKDNHEQSTATVINVDVDLPEQLHNIMQQMPTQKDCIQVAGPAPKSEVRDSETIQCDIPMSPLQFWISKGFDLSGLSSEDEIIPPSDCEDDGGEQPSCSGSLLCFDKTAAGSDDDDRMSTIIDYEAEEAEAVAWDAYRKMLEQEAEDRAYALSLQRDIKLGIDSNRSRRKDSGNKYSLRTWTRSGNT